MIENMPYTIEKEQQDFELKSAEEKERILGRFSLYSLLTSNLLFHGSDSEGLIL